jgi:hypothetical protein
MHVNLIPQPNPEEKELTEKRIGLADLAEKLSQNELELEMVKADLLVFEERYLRTVGVMYAELDKIEAQILETVARCYPLDKEAEKRASEAWDQARESACATNFIEQYKKQKHLIPSDELKKLYREAARTMHPDLTTNEEARVARQAMMVQINLAYEKGDAERLRLLLRRWLKSPESVEGEGTGAELMRVIRKIAQAEERLRVIDIKIAKSKSTDLWLLKEEVDDAEQDGRDMLTEMANAIKSKIDAAKDRLDNLKENFDYV